MAFIFEHIRHFPVDAEHTDCDWRWLDTAFEVEASCWKSEVTHFLGGSSTMLARRRPQGVRMSVLLGTIHCEHFHPRSRRHGSIAGFLKGRMDACVDLQLGPHKAISLVMVENMCKFTGLPAF